MLTVTLDDSESADGGVLDMELWRVSSALFLRSNDWMTMVLRVEIIGGMVCGGEIEGGELEVVVVLSVSVLYGGVWLPI